MTDRQLVWGAGMLAAVLIVVSVVFAPQPPVEPSRIPSTYSSAEGGARAAFLLLQESRYGVLRWEEPPAQLPRVSKGQILVLAEPTQKVTEVDRRDLQRFVTNGGRVLFCGPKIRQFFPAAEVEERPEAELHLVAVIPSRWTRGAKSIVMHTQTVWGTLNPRQLSLYESEDGPAVVWWRVGKGDVLWWAAATPLTNAMIRQSDNLQLLLNAVEPDAGPGPSIYWDEYFHGERSSLWSYVAKTVLKWGLLQVLLLALLVVFAYGRRWGPIYRPRPVRRLSPLEFVDTLGGLYERARATSVPISVSYRELKFALARRLGLDAGATDGELARAAASRLGWDRAEFEQVLGRGGVGQHGNSTVREALQVVQALEQYRLKLRPVSSRAEEKR